MINATNLTLAQQEISGILGLGFPRLSVLAHVLLGASESSSSLPSMSGGVPNDQTANLSESAYLTSR